ncbi:MAG: CHAT domain-containing protein [Chloroflexota bacterium]
MTGPGESASTADDLKAEAEGQLNVNPAQSLETAERLYGLSADARVRALGLMARGDALRVLGQPAEAMRSYTESAALYRGVGDDVGWARTRIGAVMAARHTGGHTAVLAEITEARRILERHGLWLRVARLENNAGALLSALGRNADALAAHQRALAAAERVHPRNELLEAEVLGNLSLAYYAVDEFALAEEVTDRAIAIFETEGQVEHVARARRNYARYAVGRGHFSKALAAAYAGRRTLLEAGRTEAAAHLGLVSVECLVRLDRASEAADQAHVVISEFADVGAQIEQAVTYGLRAVALTRLGEHAGALEALDAAESLFDRHRWEAGLASIRVGRAVVLGHRGEWQAALDEIGAIRDTLVDRGLVVRTIEADLVRARALRAIGDGNGATEAATSAHTLAVQRGLPWLDYHAMRSLGDVARDAGDLPAAYTAYVGAIENLERVQGRILSEYRASFLADKVDVYEPAVELALAGAAGVGDSAAATALEWAERSRARALVDALSGGVDIRVRPRTHGQRALADELSRLRDQHAAEPGLADGRGVGHIDLERRIVQVVEELRLAGVDDFERLSLLQGRVVLPRDELGDRTALIEYFPCGGDTGDLIAFVVDQRRVRAMRLPNALEGVRRTLDAFGLNLGAVAANTRSARAMAVNARALGQSLYRALIAPLADELSGLERLVIVPYGILHGVPFAALHDGQGYLLERFELAEAPSATSLSFCLRPRQRAATSRRAVVLAHSADGAMPGAVAEGHAVADALGATRFIELEATRQQLRSVAARAEVLHIAAHGQARVDAPLFSSVRLADGDLTVLECFELQLDAALVTLSACETGHGVLEPGDEQIGLTRAFIYAGARTVVHSRWRIDDRVTTSLMTRFYRELQSGRGRAASLRTAQIACLTDNATAHPFYWAPFTLVGDWR